MTEDVNRSGQNDHIHRITRRNKPEETGSHAAAFRIIGSHIA